MPTTRTSRRWSLLLYLSLVLVIPNLREAHGQLPEQLTSRNYSDVSAMYVLGDSSVDCGDNTLFYPLLHHNLSLHPCRGSDDTLIPHLLAKKMNLPLIRPFYGQNGSVVELLSGLNFGSVQATIMNSRSLNHQSLNQQLRQVFETIQLLQLRIGQETSRRFIQSSVFYLSFGKDDYTNLFFHDIFDGMIKNNGQQLANVLVEQVINAMRSLYDEDVRKIICFGVLPLGCTPRMVWEWNNMLGGYDGGRGCVDEINEMVLEFNRLLDDHIAQLNAEWSDTQVVFCDAYNAMLEIINNPQLHGFEDVRSACCGLGMNGAIVGCISMDMVCDQPSTHMWWDFYNPTETVNALLVDSSWSGQPFSGICHPISVQELVFSNQF